jgi:hypothetical protein
MRLFVVFRYKVEHPVHPVKHTLFNPEETCFRAYSLFLAGMTGQIFFAQMGFCLGNTVPSDFSVAKIPDKNFPNQIGSYVQYVAVKKEVIEFVRLYQ